MAKYAAMPSSELVNVIHSLLEPRILLAEDTYSQAVMQSRAALRVWRGLDALERAGTSSIKLDNFKESLEVALRDNDDPILTAVEKEVTTEFDRLGFVSSQSSGTATIGGAGFEMNGVLGQGRIENVDIVGRGSGIGGPYVRPESDLGAWGHGGTSTTEQSSTSSSGDGMVVGSRYAVYGAGSSFLPPLRRKHVPRWKRPFVIDKDGDGHISTFEKAWCISALAWVLAIIGCAIAISTMTIIFIRSTRNRSIQVDLEVHDSMTLPRLTWCHSDDNIPAFFEPLPDRFKGPPIMGISFFNNEAEGDSTSFPDTRNIFREVIVAHGTKKEKRECKERLKRFDIGMLEEKSGRSPDFTKCRVCLQAKTSVQLTNPTSNKEQATSSALFYIASVSRLLTTCRNPNYRAQGFKAIQAFFREFIEHFDDLVKQGYLDISEVDNHLLEPVNGTAPFFADPNNPGEGVATINLLEDPGAVKYHSFVCNMMFLSGYFYPTSGKKQKWKYSRKDKSFIPVSGGPFYKAQPFMLAQPEPPGLPKNTDASRPRTPARTSRLLHQGTRSKLGAVNSVREVSAVPPPSITAAGPSAEDGGSSSTASSDGSAGKDNAGQSASALSGAPPAEIGTSSSRVGAKSPAERGKKESSGGRGSSNKGDRPAKSLNLSFTVPNPINITRDVPPPFTPFITIYSEVVDGKKENLNNIFPGDPSDIMTRISAETVVFLRIQRENDPDGEGKYRPRRFNSIAHGDRDESLEVAYFQYTLDLAFENFLTEEITERAVYTFTRYLADSLNMLGIFLGVSVLTIMIIPATSLLIRTRSKQVQA